MNSAVSTFSDGSSTPARFSKAGLTSNFSLNSTGSFTRAIRAAYQHLHATAHMAHGALRWLRRCSAR
jgi:hypothetical protein